MYKRINVLALTRRIHHPPRLGFRTNAGRQVTEDLTRIATIDAPVDRRQYLIEHGIELTWAEYDPCTERWERCLVSEGVANLLELLYEEGSFPYPFEAGPSQGELEWLEAQSRGATERPVLPLSAYLIPADSARLAAFATTRLGTPDEPAETPFRSTPRRPTRRIFAQIQW